MQWLRFPACSSARLGDSGDPKDENNKAVKKCSTSITLTKVVSLQSNVTRQTASIVLQLDN